MTPARIAIVVVALFASIGLALFVHGVFVRPKPAPAPVVVAAPPAPAMTRVLVAKSDLAIGEKLAPDNMTWQQWPAATLNAAYITDGVIGPAGSGAVAAIHKVGTAVGDMTSGGGPKLQAMIGAIVREPIYAGQPITSKVIIRAGDSSYMAVRLPQGMRAISVPVNVESGAGGFIQPGDRIDLLSTHSDNTRGGGMVTETVLANALVLAVDQKTDAKQGAPAGGATLTLEVPEANAAAVAKSRTQGGLTMALRSYADMGGKTTSKSAQPDGQSVRIFRGGAPAETVSAP